MLLHLIQLANHLRQTNPDVSDALWLVIDGLSEWQIKQLIAGVLK